MKYEQSLEIAFRLKNGEWAFPVKVDSSKTGNLSFRSAPKGINVLGKDWKSNEVEVSEAKMISDVLTKNRRTRSVSSLNTQPNLRGKQSKDVVAVYVLAK